DGDVGAVLAGPGAGREARVDHGLPQARSLLAQGGYAVDDIHDQVIAVEVVEHDHVEGRGGGALLLVAAHVQIVVIGAPVGEAVDQPGVAVEGEDHRAVGGEQGVELAVGQPVRVLAVGGQAHHVDPVDHATPQLR